MNSTISEPTKLTVEPSIGAKYYVPFWILLEFLDTSLPDPFIQVEVLAIDTKYANSPKGPTEVLCCDLMCNGKKQLVAHNIPAQYLIAPEELPMWANQIGEWFSTFR